MANEYRFHQLAAEVVYIPTSNDSRIYQLVAEAVVSYPGAIQIGHMSAEVLFQALPGDIQISSMAVEVLRTISTSTASVRRRIPVIHSLM